MTCSKKVVISGFPPPLRTGLSQLSRNMTDLLGFIHGGGTVERIRLLSDVIEERDMKHICIRISFSSIR